MYVIHLSSHESPMYVIKLKSNESLMYVIHWNSHESLMYVIHDNRKLRLSIFRTIGLASWVFKNFSLHIIKVTIGLGAESTRKKRSWVPFSSLEWRRSWLQGFRRGHNSLIEISRNRLLIKLPASSDVSSYKNELGF